METFPLVVLAHSRKSRSWRRQLSLRSVGGYLLGLGLICRLLFWPGLKTPDYADLDLHVGSVSAVQVGGNGNATSLQVETAQGEKTFSSYLGKVWPGMARLEAGDRVRVRSSRDRAPRGRAGIPRHSWIWELTLLEPETTLVTYPEMVVVWERQRVLLNRCFDGMTLLGAILMAASLVLPRRTPSHEESGAAG